jgi:hypothetical protein
LESIDLPLLALYLALTLLDPSLLIVLPRFLSLKLIADQRSRS